MSVILIILMNTINCIIIIDFHCLLKSTVTQEVKGVSRDINLAKETVKMLKK